VSDKRSQTLQAACTDTLSAVSALRLCRSPITMRLMLEMCSRAVIAGLTCVMVAAVLWGPAVQAAEAAMAAAAAAGGSGTVAAAAAAGLRNVAAAGASASASPGDLVLLQGLLLQLWAPLQFLGWFYRWVKDHRGRGAGCSYIAFVTQLYCSRSAGKMRGKCSFRCLCSSWVGSQMPMQSLGWLTGECKALS
jgi:hypothetical protein